MKTIVRVGISGWRYKPWRGVFYPEGLAQHRELEFAGARFNTIEINGTFYSLQRPESFENWYADTPEDFVFSVKGPRFITHMKKLKAVHDPLANFFASGVLGLKEKLGPILWQFPPAFKYSSERFTEFFKLLPNTQREAAKLAKRHTDKVKKPANLRINSDFALRHVVEIRHPSFVTPEFFRLLRRFGIGLVVADTAGRWPLVEEVTSSTMYCRLHGDKELYASGYTRKALKKWASKIKRWASNRMVKEIFVYFDNDVKVHAPVDASNLERILTGPEQRRS